MNLRAAWRENEGERGGQSRSRGGSFRKRKRPAAFVSHFKGILKLLPGLERQGQRKETSSVLLHLDSERQAGRQAEPAKLDGGS